MADFVGGKAILGHRVVTLSRKIFAAILARNCQEDEDELARLGIPRIDLVCVDPYPVAEAIKQARSIIKIDSSRIAEAIAMVIEKTDIGGMAIPAAAAKAGIIVIYQPDQMERTINWLSAGRPDAEAFLNEQRETAFRIISQYYGRIAHFFADLRKAA